MQYKNGDLYSISQSENSANRYRLTPPTVYIVLILVEWQLCEISQKHHRKQSLSSIVNKIEFSTEKPPQNLLGAKEASSNSAKSTTTEYAICKLASLRCYPQAVQHISQERVEISIKRHQDHHRFALHYVG